MMKDCAGLPMVILPAHTGGASRNKKSTPTRRTCRVEKLSSLTVVILVRRETVGTGRGSTSKSLAVAVGERSTPGVSLSGRLRDMVLSLEAGKGLVQDGKVDDAVRPAGEPPALRAASTRRDSFGSARLNNGMARVEGVSTGAAFAVARTASARAAEAANEGMLVGDYRVCGNEEQESRGAGWPLMVCSSRGERSVAANRVCTPKLLAHLVHSSGSTQVSSVDSGE